MRTANFTGVVRSFWSPFRPSIASIGPRISISTQVNFKFECDILGSKLLFFLIIYRLFLGKIVSLKHRFIRCSGLVIYVPLNRFPFSFFSLLFILHLHFAKFDTLMNGLERGWKKGACYDLCFQLLRQKATS